MSAVLRRVLQRFSKPAYLVGRDLEGNKYYEYPNSNDDRPKRTVQYKRTEDMWAYIASGKRLPVQWNAWLTHTRPNPPSIEELQADLARQQRVQMNAAILEARDREEHDRTARLSQPSRSQLPERSSGKVPELRRNEPPLDVRPDSVSIPNRDPWAEAKHVGPDEPQSWNPIVRR